MLPKVKELEEKYESSEVVFVGVHSAKFTNEKESSSIREAILKYNVSHPVVNDASMKMWNFLGIEGWPSLCVIGPDGKVLLLLYGEGTKGPLDTFLQAALEFYRTRDVELNTRKVSVNLNVCVAKSIRNFQLILPHTKRSNLRSTS